MAERLLGRRKFLRAAVGLGLESGAVVLALKKNPYGFVKEAFAQTVGEVNVEGGVWKPGVNSVIWLDNERRTSDIKEVLDKIGTVSDFGPRALWMLTEGEWKFYFTTAGVTSTLKDIPPTATFQVDLAGPTSLPEKYPNYYKQYAYAAGITVKASEKVDPATLKEAKKMALKMTSFRPDIRSKLIERGAYIMLVPKGENVPVLPELAHFRGQRTADGRSYDTQIPGLSGGITTAIPENELIDPKPDRFRINTHEFGHTIMNLTFTPRELAINQSALNTAKREGYLKDDYSQTNALEFWAEHSRAWFDRDLGRIGGPEEILRRNPEIYNLLMEVYGPSLVTPKKS